MDQLSINLVPGYPYQLGDFLLILDKNSLELKVIVTKNNEELHIKPSSGNSVILKATK